MTATGHTTNDSFENQTNPRAVFKNLSDEDWLAVLIRSIDEPCIDGIDFPRFPDESVQISTVGSANENALREAFAFYREIRKYAALMKIPFDRTTHVLDFGCGWGRHYRFFMKNVPTENILGVDCHPGLIELCQATNPAGQFKTVPACPPIDLEPESLDIIFAYSVFSHLNEPVGLAWISEFARLLKPGGLAIVTTHSHSFPEFCESLRNAPETQKGFWQQTLARIAFTDLTEAKNRYDCGEFLYAPTGGGPALSPELYGEAVLSKKYVLRKWTEYFKLIDFLDNPSILAQAVIVLRKKSLEEWMMESVFPKINLTISPNDEVYHYAKSQIKDEEVTKTYYRDTGKKLAINLIDFLQHEGLSANNLDLLDFAAGYGRVTRWLVPCFKTVEMADTESDMLDFHRREYGISGFLINNDPRSLAQFDKTYDVIFVFSLFTHLPDRTWELWLQAISRMVRPKGFLVFSTHSYELFAELNPAQFGDPATWVEPFLFWETNETNSRLETSVYGCTIVKDSFVRQVVDRLSGFRSVRHFTKNQFDLYHDIYIIQKI